MKNIIKEIVYSYPKSLLNEWKSGSKSWIPEGLFVPNDVYTQPAYHFGEYFTLAKYQELGWHGSAFYALGEWEPNNTKYDDGRRLIEKHIDPKRLSVFRALRKGMLAGEPDLFLCKPDGTVLFLEVKKEADKISQAQLDCLSQIKSILGYEVGVVYLAEEGKNYKPKSYELDYLEFPRRWFD